jgi:hypothetical protein
MTDPVSVASLALSLIKTADEQLNKLRERSQSTKDLEIKKYVGNLYDTMNAIKEAFSRFADENKELKRQLEQQSHEPEKPKIMQVGDTQYYFLNGGADGPYCQPCYDTKEKLIKLPPSALEWWCSQRMSCVSRVFLREENEY